MRPSLTRTAPSRMAGAETGRTSPAAKMVVPGSGIPSDHFGGYDLQELALGAVRQQPEPFERGVYLAPGPRLGLGDGVGGEHRFYAGLEQLRRGVRRGEDLPDRRRVPLPEREDDRQRHSALGEVRPDSFPHQARLSYQVHNIVGHLESYPERLPVGRQRVYLPEREPAKGAASHARGFEQTRRLLPYVLQVRLDVHGRPVRPVLLELSGREALGSLGEGAHQPWITCLCQLGEGLRE